MSAWDGFYYNRQLHNYILQFMAIFANMKVSVGKTGDIEPRLIKVPIKNGSTDRVVADTIGENTQNKPLRLPMLSAYLQNIELAPELRKGVGQTRRQTYMPKGALYPDGANVVEQRMPVPYRGFIELGIFASNQDQHYQIQEQILSLFDPQLQIQTSDELFDWTKITTVTLEGIRFEENFPAGADRRIIQSTLDFSLPMYLSVPAEVHKRYVQDIFVRVGAVNLATKSSEEIICEMDELGIEYDNCFSATDVDLE